ncbi:MAG: hypothetical protein AVDCRST_MAG13-640 [uncultured Solirubrobacteraceae bacterium]|uniref:EfeO-type cupredoxin-like domain-containing protein n=1 Tax=uncultured Solirubrobacteraceae bacterium TaxID=1162706 RepID=A0A6J4RRU8_9ACTN|nr:MAG: hypothetical protein AVDCRST_MAG13-640 [uncultured Solirubrobacteraceae bacterium]
MERGQRIAFAMIAAVIAVVAVVVLSGGSDPETNRADRPPATAASDSTATPEPQEAEPQATATATPRPKPGIQTVRYRDGKVVGGRTRLDVDKGETVRFAVASDVAEEIHVHGYDRYVDIPAGGSKRITFKADIEGIFEVELHDAGLEIAQLRVNP